MGQALALAKPDDVLEPSKIEQIFLKAGNMRGISPGSAIVEEGQPVSSVFYVLRGEVEIWTRFGTKEEMRLGKVSPNEVIGELSFLLLELPTVTARVSRAHKGDVSVIEMERTRAHDLMNHDPLFAAKVFRMLAALIAQRIANTSQAKKAAAALIAQHSSLGRPGAPRAGGGAAEPESVNPYNVRTSTKAAAGGGGGDGDGDGELGAAKPPAPADYGVDDPGAAFVAQCKCTAAVNERAGSRHSLVGGAAQEGVPSGVVTTTGRRRQEGRRRQGQGQEGGQEEGAGVPGLGPHLRARALAGVHREPRRPSLNRLRPSARDLSGTTFLRIVRLVDRYHVELELDTVLHL